MAESKPRSDTGEKRGLDAAGGDTRKEGLPLDSGGAAPGSPNSSTMCRSKFKEGERPGEYRLGSTGRVWDRDLDTAVVGGGWISAMVVVCSNIGSEFREPKELGWRHKEGTGVERGEREEIDRLREAENEK